VSADSILDLLVSAPARLMVSVITATTSTDGRPNMLLKLIITAGEPCSERDDGQTNSPGSLFVLFNPCVQPSSSQKLAQVDRIGSANTGHGSQIAVARD
jgi:hypothetical protein